MSVAFFSNNIYNLELQYVEKKLILIILFNSINIKNTSLLKIRLTN